MNMTTMGTFYEENGYLMSSLATKHGTVDFILPDEGVDVRSLLASGDMRTDILGRRRGGGIFGRHTFW